LARFVAKDDGVFMERMCPVLGIQSVKVVSDRNWFMERLSESLNCNSPKSEKKFEHGCPLDCGLCENHSIPVHLPVFSITNDCNLNCKICFTYNRPDKKYYKSPQDTKKIIDHIFNQVGDLDLINLQAANQLCIRISLLSLRHVKVIILAVLQ